ncbi:MAG: ABC transporter permease [Candidatus Microthrix sp.]|nr:ABC transporter permease [Candidatus Microthrix sp.]MBK7019389.1 ABC transporter permease [Candidatus Microthrix sp.]
MTAITNPTSSNGRSAPAPAASEALPKARGALHDVWVIARRGLIHMKRQPEQLSDATIQPVMFVVMFAYVFGGAIVVPGGGNATPQRYREFLMGGIMAQTLVFTAFGVALGLANDRKSQAVDRFRSLPISRGAVLGGHAVANIIKTLLPIALMSITGYIIGWRIRGSVFETLGAYALMVAFAFAMIWIGVLLGSLVSTPEGVNGIAFVALFPLDVHRLNVCSDLLDARPAPHHRLVEPDYHRGRRAQEAVWQPQCAGPAGRPVVAPPPGCVLVDLDHCHHHHLRAVGGARLPTLHRFLTARPGHLQSLPEQCGNSAE